MNIVLLLAGLALLTSGIRSGWDGLRFRFSRAGLPLGRLLVPFWLMRIGAAVVLTGAGVYLLYEGW